MLRLLRAYGTRYVRNAYATLAVAVRCRQSVSQSVRKNAKRTVGLGTVSYAPFCLQPSVLQLHSGVTKCADVSLICHRVRLTAIRSPACLTGYGASLPPPSLTRQSSAPCAYVTCSACVRIEFKTTSFGLVRSLRIGSWNAHANVAVVASQ